MAWTQELARALGLGIVPGPHSERTFVSRRRGPEFFGYVEGEGVYVGQRRRKPHTFTYVDIVFDPPFKRGLVVWHVDGDRFLVHHDLVATPTGTRLDYAYKVYGDPRLVAPIVTAPEVERVLAVDRGKFSTFASDRFVRIECDDEIDDVALIRAQIVDAVALARAVRAAIEAGPSVLEEEAALVWQPICERAGLTYDVRAIRGTRQSGMLGVRVEAMLDESGTWRTEIEASFSPSLAVGLNLETEGIVNKLTRYDVHLGDPVFDEAFLVEGKDARRVVEILTPTARAALLALRPHGQLRVNDDVVHIALPGVLTDGALLAFLIENVLGAATAMLEHRAIAPVGPYR